MLTFFAQYSTLNTPYMVAALDHGHTLVLPQQQIKKIYNLPEDVLDAHNVQNETMQMHYTFPDRLLNEEPLHNNVIRNQLTRNIPKLTPVVAGEIEFGFERAWGTDQKWKEIRGWSSALRIMAGAANGAFCGQPLCTSELLPFAQLLRLSLTTRLLMIRISRPQHNLP